MSTTTRARTARKPHLCDGCHWTPSLRGKPTIALGHRYLLHTAFPDGEINQSNRPYTNTECVACAADRDGHAPLLDAGACGTFCHGETPCALPFRHDGDHCCRTCLDHTPAPLAAAR